jgi:thioesterase domain-containing protein/acyl carrier protein
LQLGKLHHRTSRPSGLRSGGLTRGEVASELRLSLAEDWIVSEHRMLDGTGLFPGTGYVEMILNAAQELVPGERITIQDLQFKLPLEVPSGVSRRVRTKLRRLGDDYQFAAEADTDGDWLECAAARVTLDHNGAVAAQDLAGLRQRCANRELIFSHRQNRVQESFFDFGPRWQVLERIGFGQDEALVTICLPAEFLSELDTYRVHPALLDMASGTALFLVPDYESLHRAYVPMNYGQITVRERLPRRFYSHIRIRAGYSADEPVVVFDADILDEAGNSLVEIREFMMRRVEDGLKSVMRTVPTKASQLATSGKTDHAEQPRDSFVTVDGVAAFRSVLNGGWAANIVTFPSDFVAYAQAAQPGRAVPHIPAGSGNDDLMRDEVERTIAQWWRELLGAESLTPQSDFFEMGGQSLTAVRLFAKIKKSYGIQLSAATIYEVPTVEKLATRIRNGKEAAVVVPKSSLIPIRLGGARHPLYLFPDMHGTVIGFDALIRRLPRDLPVYGVESTWLSEVDVPLRLEEMAARQLESVRALQPRGPFYFLGYSFGGLMAFEAAQQLVAAGERVGMLGMLDTWQIGHIRALDAVHRRSQKLVRRARKALVHAQRLWTGPERLTYFEDHFIERYRRELSLAIFALLVRYSKGHIPPFLRNPSQINMFAAQHYVAGRYPGRITMFRAAQGIANEDPRYDDSLGWRNHAEKGVEVHEVPGTHRDILREPNVQILAGEISQACMNNESTSEDDFVEVSR